MISYSILKVKSIVKILIFFYCSTKENGKLRLSYAGGLFHESVCVSTLISSSHSDWLPLMTSEAIEGLYGASIRLPCRISADMLLFFQVTRQLMRNAVNAVFCIGRCFSVWNAALFTRIIIKDIKTISIDGFAFDENIPGAA